METLFSEKQRFTQPWIWVLLIGLNVLFLYGIVQQLIFKIPFGNNPAPDGLLVTFAFIPIAITWLFLRFELTTEITKEAIFFQLKPFQSKKEKIEWTAIEKAYLRTYSPLKEYGGWGYRLSSKGKAYNVRGNQGLQLELKNGKKILIGTQKAADLERVLNDEL